jgi:hypothetical protein
VHVWTFRRTKLDTALSVRTIEPAAQSTTLLEKLMVAQPVNNLSAFYETRKFVTVFTTVRHWTLPKAGWIQSTALHPVYLRYILILFSDHSVGPSCGLYPSSFRIKFRTRFTTYPIHLDTIILSDYANLSYFFHCLQFPIADGGFECMGIRLKNIVLLKHSVVLSAR